MPGDLRATLRLQADGRGFRGEIRMSQRELDRLTRSTRDGVAQGGRYAAATREVERATRGAGRAFAEAHGHQVRYLTAGLGVHQLVRAVRSVAQATIAQEQAFAQVEARIRSTGGAAGVTAEEMAALATSLQRVSTVGDEAILGAQSILLSFRSISGAELAGAVEAALDLAAALGTDLRSAALQLGRALEDPERGLDALRRSGTTFTDEQRDTIRALVEAGRSAEAQRLILAELEVQYGGAAAAARDTFGGALTALGNALGDLTEIQTETTNAWRGWIAELTESVERVDVRALHAALADLREIVYVVGAALGVRFVAAVAAAGVASVRAAARIGTAATALGRLGTAARFAGVGLRLLSGPVGWLSLAAVAGYELYRAISDSSEALERLGNDAPGAARGVREIAQAVRAMTDADRGAREEFLLAERNRLIAEESDLRAARSDAVVDRSYSRARRAEIVAAADREIREASERGAAPDEIRSLGPDTDAIDRQLARANDRIQAIDRQRAQSERNLQAVREELRAIRDVEARRSEGGDGGASTATTTAAAIERHVAALERRVTLTADATHEARALYDLDRGGLRAATDAQREQILSFARTLDVREAAIAATREEAEESRRAADAAAENARAVAEIGRAAAELAGPYAAARLAAEEWRTETLAGLDEAAAGYEEWAAEVERIFRERIAAAGRDAAKELERSAERVGDAWRRAAREIAAEAGDSASDIEDLMRNAARSLEDVFATAATGGGLSFRRMIDGMIADLARLAARRSIIEPLFEALAGLGGRGGGGIAGILGGLFGRGGGGGRIPIGFGHEGGVAGALRTTRSVDPGLFRGAPRLHRGGIAGDEVPAILRRGEGVFTPEQMAALGGARVPEVHVEIVNRGAPLREAEAPRQRLDADRLVVDIVVDDIASGGRVARALEHGYGARPAVA